MQHDIFTSQPLRNAQDQPWSLREIVRWYTDNELLKPKFQRDYVWKFEQEKGWCQSIVENKAIGVIVTYQLPQGGPVFLADGLQRITATTRFLADPQQYGFSFGVDQASEHVKRFAVTVQHRHYKSHEEAMTAFQRLNKGTALEPYDFWKGTMVLDDRGAVIHESVPLLLTAYESRFVSGKRVPPKAQAKFNRDAFALFYRYVSGIREQYIGGVGNSAVSSGRTTPIEIVLMDWVRNSNPSMSDVAGKMKQFDVLISQNAAQLQDVLIELGANGKSVSRTLLRWNLHVMLWARNNNKPMTMYWKLIRNFFGYLNQYQSFGARFPLPQSDPVIPITLALGDTKELLRLCRTFDVELVDTKRKSRQPAAKGYHNSHIFPYAIDGEGDTLIEPAPANLMRGAKLLPLDTALSP